MAIRIYLRQFTLHSLLLNFMIGFGFFVLPLRKKYRPNKQQGFSYSEHWELSWIHSHYTLFCQNCVLAVFSDSDDYNAILHLLETAKSSAVVLYHRKRSDKKSLASPASMAYRKQNHFCLHTEKPLRDNMKITRHHSSHFAEVYCILIFH